MGIFGKLFGRSSTPASVVDAATPAPVTSAVAVPEQSAAPPRALVFDEEFAATDARLMSVVHKVTESRLAGLQERFLDIFNKLLQEAHGDPPTEFVAVQLKTLTWYLAKWSVDLPSEIHTTIRSMLAEPWELKEGDDPLDEFFGAFANASHYDAIMFEEVMRVATSTFDAAVARAVDAFPSLSTDERRTLAWIWDYTHWAMQGQLSNMRRARVSAVLRSPSTYDRPEVLLKAAIEMFRGHFELCATNEIRRYRWIFLPIVTQSFATQDMITPLSKLDVDVVDTLRYLAFDGFPESRIAQSPGLEAAYLFAWHDAFGRRQDTKSDAIKKGREEYARELKVLDNNDQFERYCEACVDQHWQVLFSEIRDFYVRAAAALPE